MGDFGEPGNAAQRLRNMRMNYGIEDGKRQCGIKLWYVWREGFNVGEHSDVARFMGKTIAETFEEACKNVMGEPGTSKWGARLFDNEIDARKAFG